MESGAGSTMLKFGLLFLLANCFLKLFLGIGIWKMAMENKAGMKSSIKYEEEKIGEGDSNILRGRNDFSKQEKTFQTSGQDNRFRLKESGEEEED